MKLVAQLVDNFYLGKHNIAMMHVDKGIQSQIELITQHSSYIAWLTATHI